MAGGGGVAAGDAETLELQVRIIELERQMAGMHALLLQRSPQMAPQMTPQPTAVAGGRAPYSVSATFDATSADAPPSSALFTSQSHHAPNSSPRSTHKRMGMATRREDTGRGRCGGEAGGAARGGAAGGDAAVGGATGSARGDGPPFRSHVDRKQWLLQEKRRWLVEMRLGRRADATDVETDYPPAEKLPPIAQGSCSPRSIT